MSSSSSSSMQSSSRQFTAKIGEETFTFFFPPTSGQDWAYPEFREGLAVLEEEVTLYSLDGTDLFCGEGACLINVIDNLLKMEVAKARRPITSEEGEDEEEEEEEDR